MLVGRRTRGQLTVMPKPLTVARGSEFGLAKALKDAAETFVLRLPR